MSKIDNKKENKIEKLFLDKKVLEVIVKPNSSSKEIVYDSEKQVFIIKVKAQAEDGKANSEVLKLIKKETGKEPKIISGATSKKKLIRLD